MPVVAAQVKCCECGYESNTMESFMDICLDIGRAGSLAHALERYTKPEMLDRENKYKCPKQGRLVRARKTITIERVPNVLVFQLKRFEYSMYGSKIGKKVRRPAPLMHFFCYPSSSCTRHAGMIVLLYLALLTSLSCVICAGQWFFSKLCSAKDQACAHFKERTSKSSGGGLAG